MNNLISWLVFAICMTLPFALGYWWLRRPQPRPTHVKDFHVHLDRHNRVIYDGDVVAHVYRVPGSLEIEIFLNVIAIKRYPWIKAIDGVSDRITITLMESDLTVPWTQVVTKIVRDELLDLITYGNHAITVVGD